MNEKLKKFLEAKKEAEKNKYEEEREKTLIELGLFEKIYSSDNSYSEEFPDFEWDSANSTNKYYKIVPIEITDEEFQEVKKYIQEDDKTENNSIATALTVIAWILFGVGVIAGVFAMGISFALTLIYWCVSLVSGTMFLGFAEIIKLLNAIKNK